MASEGGLFGSINPRLAAPALLGFSALLALLAFGQGWFSVDTRLQVWEYDPNDEQGKGAPRPEFNARINTEMRMLRLDTEIQPRQAHDFIEENAGLPSYDEEAGRTGTRMLGIFLLHAVAALSLAAATGLYFWNRKSRRDLGPSVWRFAGLFGGFAVLTVGYLAAAVPGAAERDTRDVLEEYVFYLESRGLLPELDPQMLRPNVEFWNTWVCCPPNSHFPRNGVEYLVVVTTESRPSAGFWMESISLTLAAVGLVLATRTGEFEAKADGPEPDEPPRAPAPSKTA